MSPIWQRRDFLKIAVSATAGMPFCAPAPPLGTRPFFRREDLFVAGADGVREYRIPALVTTTKGTLLALCDARVEAPGDAPNNIDLVLKRSEDQGETWSEMNVVADFPGRRAAADPCMLIDGETGKVWVIYDHVWPDSQSLERAGVVLPKGVRPDGTGRIIMLHAIFSEDDGKTWSEPVDITHQLTREGWLAVMAAPGRGIQMNNGRLVVPCYSRRMDGSGRQGDFSSVAYSDDGGKNWRLGSGAGPATNECQVVELANGDLMLNMRSYHGKGCRAVATSTDGGETWSELSHDDTLIEPRCQASFIRYGAEADSGGKDRLLFSNPAHRKERVNMTVRLSLDSGATWPVSKAVHPGPAAYSCLTVLEDGKIGLLYENGAGSPYERISFACFNPEWLTGADLQSGQEG